MNDMLLVMHASDSVSDSVTMAVPVYAPATTMLMATAV